MISLTKFKTFLNVPGPFFSILPDPSIINPRSALALHSTTREEEWNHGVQLRNMLLMLVDTDFLYRSSIYNFLFPNLINFLKLAECALSIDSECYCLMSGFFAPYSCFLVAPETLVLTNPFHFSLQII